MLAVISHDAGGAEILSSYVRRQPGPCVFALAGPARDVFERKLGPITIVPLAEAIDQATSLLCGTSWESSLEFDALTRARLAGKRSVSFLDHWVNYRERFTRGGRICLPDEIWVGDAMAETKARDLFPGTTVRVTDNPYYQDILTELATQTPARPANPDRLSVLYVCAPIRAQALAQFGDEHYWGYVEEDALRALLANVGALGRPVERIVIRRHPAEPAGKYDWARDEFDLPIEAGGGRTLVEEIGDCDVVAGCASMAMVVGLLARKRVVSCIPPKSTAFRLPHPDIERLHDLCPP